MKQTQKSKDMMKQQQEYVIEAQKKMQEMIKGMMVQSTVEYEKILDPKDCYSPELLGGNPEYIKGICSKMPDPTGPVDIKVFLFYYFSPLEMFFFYIRCSQNAWKSIPSAHHAVAIILV